jgi:hypothetical protein
LNDNWVALHIHTQVMLAIIKRFSGMKKEGREIPTTIVSFLPSLECDYCRPSPDSLPEKLLQLVYRDMLRLGEKFRTEVKFVTMHDTLPWSYFRSEN